ncbi:MAG: hypothetical protein ABUS79_06490 [Pseudomonadota bacterium]
MEILWRGPFAGALPVRVLPRIHVFVKRRSAFRDVIAAIVVSAVAAVPVTGAIARGTDAGSRNAGCRSWGDVQLSDAPFLIHDREAPPALRQSVRVETRLGRPDDGRSGPTGRGGPDLPLVTPLALAATSALFLPPPDGARGSTGHRDHPRISRHPSSGKCSRGPPGLGSLSFGS